MAITEATAGCIGKVVSMDIKPDGHTDLVSIADLKQKLAEVTVDDVNYHFS